MSLPLRINEATFSFSTLDVVTTPVDSDFREPVSHKKRAAQVVNVIGQVSRMVETLNRLQRTQTGDAKPETMHAVFRPKQLADAGLTLKKGDRLVKISVNGDTIDVDLIITAVTKGSYLASQKKNLLVHVDFEQNRDTLGSL